ncbi:MAG: pyridoxal phosphate-dependent aminotransferase [Thermodesulfobacteriota bacterium]
MINKIDDIFILIYYKNFPNFIMPSTLSLNISPFYVMEILDKAKEMEEGGEDIIHFEVGEPDFPTSGLVCDEAVDSIRKGYTKYTHSLGIAELRSAISRKYKEEYKLKVSEDRVIVTMGSSPALFLTILSIIDSGDEVIITDPHYACYPQLIKIAGGVPRFLKIYEDEFYQIDVSRLKNLMSEKTKAIIINSPSNPTGAILSAELLSQLAGIGIDIISDEIYHGLVYDDEINSMLEFKDDAFVINGFSKYYSMTGWRLGFCIVPRDFVRPIQKLQQNLFISPCSFVQMAGISAIEKAGFYSREMVDELNKRRLLMLSGLRGLGFDVSVEPKGAFYVFVNVKSLSMNSRDLAFDILEKSLVAVTPGIDFGESGEGYLRFSYATSQEKIKEGVSRLGGYFNG